MESLNLVTVDELKKGTVFYFENDEHKLELSWSEFEQSYVSWYDLFVFKTVNFTELKRYALALIKLDDLQLTHKPMTKEIDFNKIKDLLQRGDRTKITKALIRKGVEYIGNTEVGSVIRDNNINHPKAKLIWDEANEIINGRKK